jgi:lysophospholipase L1-like esterase
VAAVGGVSTSAGLALLRSKGASLPQVVVVALGTNDGSNARAFADKVDAVLEVVGGRRLVWVDVAHPGVADGLNAVLADRAVSHPNLEVLSWSTQVQPQWLAADRIHLTSAGYRARAQATVEALGPYRPCPLPAELCLV